METAWYVLITFMLTTYVVLDGFDFGVGIVHLFVAKEDFERRTTFAAIGPVWDGNEVWLIAAGGVLVFAFPRAYSAALSGFYLPLMMVLWLIILRGISIEFRSLEANPLWRSFWDTTFAFSSTVVALVLGASLGNVIRGVPLDGSGFFHAPLFTNLRTGREPGALDWYTLLVGAFALVLLAGHGTLYLAWKTDGVVGARCTRLAPRLWIATLALLLPVTLATAVVQPALFARLAAHPVWWLLSLPILGGPIAVFLSLRRANPLGAFLGSSAFIAAMMVATSAGLFPYLLRSTLADPHSLTIHNASSAHHGLLLGFLWWTPAMLLALGYFTYLFRSFRGKVHPSDYSH